MYRFMRLAHRYVVSLAHDVLLEPRNRQTVAAAKGARRNRFARTLRSKRSRIVFCSRPQSSGTLPPPCAEVLLAKTSPTLITGLTGNAVIGGTAELVAALTSSGIPVSGKRINFKIRGHAVGGATTNGQGIAILTLAHVKGVYAGFYPISASFGGGGGYKSTSAKGTVTVSRMSTTITDVSGSGAYGGNATLTAVLSSGGAPLSGITLQFLVFGYTVGTATTNSQGLATLPYVSLPGLNAGTYAGAVNANFPGNLTYRQSASGGGLTMTASQATITLGGLNATYNGIAHSATVSTSPAGLPVTLTYENSSGNPVTSPTAVGTYSVTATIDTPNYTGSATGSLVIAPAPLSVTGITAANKMYDGNTMATINTTGAILVGVVSGDVVGLDTSGATGTFATKNVAIQTVTISGLSLTGASAGNYVLVPPTTTADITAAPLTVTGITAVSKPYDGTNSAALVTTGATLHGVLSGDSVTLNTSTATGTFATASVGTGITVTVSGLTLSGTDAGNYVLQQPTTTANITAATLMVTGITAASKVYDATTAATLNTSGAMLTGVVSGDSVTLNSAGAIGTFVTKDVGTGILVSITGLSISGASAANYVLAVPSTTASITPAPLTVTGITAQNKTYDGTTAATLVTTGAMLSGVILGDSVTLNTSGAAGTFATANVGTGITVTVSGLFVTGADAGNYALTEPMTTANITPLMLTVTGITAQNKPYDGTTAATLNTSGAMLMGVVNGDNIVLNVSAAVGTFANAGPGTGIVVNITGLTISGTEAEDYDLVQPMTTANIT